MNQIKNKIIITGLLFLVSFIIRAVFLVFVRGTDVPLDGDEGSYHVPASEVVQGNRWENSDRPPLTTIVLIPLYFMFGPEIIMGRLLMIIISSLTAPAIFLFVNTIFIERKNIGIIAAGFWCIYPPSIFYSSLILTENLSSFLIVISLGLLYTSIRRPNILIMILTGVCMGLSTLNRSSFYYLPVFLLIANIVLFRYLDLNFKNLFRQWIFIFIGTTISLMPWTINNYINHGIFIPIESRLGTILYVCNSDLTHEDIQAGMYYKNPYIKSVISEELSQIEIDNMMKKIAIAEIKKNWRLLPKPLFNRAKNFWTFRPDPYDPHFTRNDWIMLFIWLPTLIFFVISFRSKYCLKNWPMSVVILYAFLTTLPFWGIPRFRFPVDPFIIIGAVIGGALVFDHYKKEIIQNRL